MDELMQMVVSLGFMTTVPMPHCAAHSVTQAAAAAAALGQSEWGADWTVAVVGGSGDL